MSLKEEPSMSFVRRFILAIAITAACSTVAYAQRDELQSNLSEDSAFVGRFYNKEYDVFMVINFHDANVTPPGHEIYGPLPGYLGKPSSSFYWMIIEAEVEDKKANLQIINDFGSEDLTAKLVQLNDSTFRLTQGKGSTIKIPDNGKWMKLPKSLDFMKR